MKTFLKIFKELFGELFKIITFATDIRIFSCLFVKFVLYTSRFLGEGTCFLFCYCCKNVFFVSSHRFS